MMKKKVKTVKPKKSVKIRVRKSVEKPVKVKVRVQKVLKEDFTPQGETYWRERAEGDPHKDWGDHEGTWLDGYVQSKDHPHRKLIIEALEKVEPFSVVAEIGCGVGTNLGLIKDRFRAAEMRGIDINLPAVEKAREYFGTDKIVHGSVIRLPWDTKSVDVLISDAVLLYVGPGEIETVMREIDRVTKKAVILVERFADSLGGEIKGFVWGRNYLTLLDNLGFKVSVKQLTKETWPESENWVKYGIIVSGFRPA